MPPQTLELGTEAPPRPLPGLEDSLALHCGAAGLCPKGHPGWPGGSAGPARHMNCYSDISWLGPLNFPQEGSEKVIFSHRGGIAGQPRTRRTGPAYMQLQGLRRRQIETTLLISALLLVVLWVSSCTCGRALGSFSSVLPLSRIYLSNIKFCRGFHSCCSC